MAIRESQKVINKVRHSAVMALINNHRDEFEKHLDDAYTQAGLKRRIAKKVNP